MLLLPSSNGPQASCTDLLAVTLRISCLCPAEPQGHQVGQATSPSRKAADVCMSFAPAASPPTRGDLEEAGSGAGEQIGQRAGSSGPGHPESEGASLQGQRCHRPDVHLGGAVLSVSYTVGRPACGIPGRRLKMQACLLSSDEEFACERAHLSGKVVPLLRRQVASLGANFSWVEATWSATESERWRSDERVKLMARSYCGADATTGSTVCVALLGRGGAPVPRGPDGGGCVSAEGIMDGCRWGVREVLVGGSEVEHSVLQMELDMAFGATGASRRVQSLSAEVSRGSKSDGEEVNGLLEAAARWAAEPGDGQAWDMVVSALGQVQERTGVWGSKGRMDCIEGVERAGSGRDWGGGGGGGGVLAERLGMILSGLKGLVLMCKASGVDTECMVLAGEKLRSAQEAGTGGDNMKKIKDAVGEVKRQVMQVEGMDEFDLEREALGMLCSVDDIEEEPSHAHDAYRRGHEKTHGEMVRDTTSGDGALQALVDTIEAHRDAVDGGGLCEFALERLGESAELVGEIVRRALGKQWSFELPKLREQFISGSVGGAKCHGETHPAPAGGGMAGVFDSLMEVVSKGRSGKGNVQVEVSVEDVGHAAWRHHRLGQLVGAVQEGKGKFRGSSSPYSILMSRHSSSWIMVRLPSVGCFGPHTVHGSEQVLICAVTGLT